MFNCHECHLFEITHPTLIQNKRGKIFHIYSVLNELFSPTSGLEQAGSFGSKLPPKNLQILWFSVDQAQILLIRRVYKISCFALLTNVWSMVNFRFQNILNRKLVNIFISVPKTLNASDHVHLDRNKQKLDTTYKQLRVFVKT